MISDEIEDLEHILPCLAIMGTFTPPVEFILDYILQLRAEPEFRMPECGIDTVAKDVFALGTILHPRGDILCRISYDSNFCVFEAAARRRETSCRA